MSTQPDQPETKQGPISSDTGVRAALRGEHPVTDARGLFLRVRATKKRALTRRWIVRVTIGGRRRKFGLGSYPTVTLAEARRKAEDAHRDVADGKEPGVRAKRREQAAQAARTLTLGEAIARAPTPRYKSPNSLAIRERALHGHFAPLHHRDVAKITAVDIAPILQTLPPPTAIRSRTCIRAVFSYAMTALEPSGVRIIDPTDSRRLRAVGWSARPLSESTSHAAVDWRGMPEVVAELAQMNDVAATCALLIAATAVRAQTARRARWTDVNFEKRTWTPPLADLKDGRHHKRPFIVPLNDVALDALERMCSRSSGRYVFANSGSGPINDAAITALIRKLRRLHDDWRDPHTNALFTVHGFRASFRTFAEENRRNDGPLAELCLGHKVHGEVAGRYIRTGLVEERRALLDLWSRHLRGKTAEVITLRA